MTLDSILIVLAAITNGLLAGASFDAALVKLPARKRIGAPAYAVFARGNDLGNGLVVYPALAGSAALLAFLATGAAVLNREPASVLLPLALASCCSVIHFFFTSRAAPVMLSLRKAPDDIAALGQKLDRFAYWHTWRAIFQMLAFLALLWAQVAIR